MKRPTHPRHGWICALDAERGSGRIEADDGRILFFHRTSLIGSRFQELKTGIEVRFVEASGHPGARAATVQVIS